jgi:hypothetical protein
VSKVFSGALHEGSVKAFYFILGHYVERNLQYGLLHTDLTPRPAFVAFAAVGRLLNGAKPIGRVDLADEKLKAFAFKTQIDGAAKETLVAWSETDENPVAIGAAEATYDYLGRELPHKKRVKLTRAPVFFIMPPGGSKKLIVQTPPEQAKWRDGNACPVVLQLLGTTAFEQSAFYVGQSTELKLVAYNFGERAVRGKLVIEGAAGSAGEITIAPGARDERTIEVDGAGRVSASLDLGDDGKAIVSARTTTIPPAPKRNK